MRMSRELSDRLYSMRRALADHDQGGVILSGDQVRGFIAELKNLGVLAQQLENEVSRHRWNEAARKDLARIATETAAITAEAARPGTNLRLLGRMALPIGDGAAS